jgi:DNA-binding response OmpR family regulator
MRILVVEDDGQLRSMVAHGLRNAGYAVDEAEDGARAIEQASSVDYDLACLDLGLPDLDGLDVCHHLLASDRRPRRLLILTARDDVAARIAGLDAGADDYLTKPFDFGELVARVRALGRRSDQRGAELTVGDLTLNDASGVITRAGTELDLTAREFAVLRHLMVHAGELVSLEDLIEHVWDETVNPLTHSARVILSRVRKKLGQPCPIVTVPGRGYRLEAP